MCLIIANPKCNTIPDDHIERAFRTNHDGFGVMYADENQTLKTIRGMFTLDNVKTIFRGLEKANIPYVAHFRFATHGTKNRDNCHPFHINNDAGGVAMVHNGTLMGSHWRSNSRSDTAILTGLISQHIADGEFATDSLFEREAPEILSRYGRDIGSDKLVFMNGKGDINIVNEKQGSWLDDCWYSNMYSIGNYTFSEFSDWYDDDETASSTWISEWMKRHDYPGHTYK